MASWQRLRDNEDFQALFLEGPLYERIRGLENKLRDIEEDDPDEVLKTKHLLAGINLVRGAVEKMAEAEHLEQQRSLRPTASNRVAGWFSFLPARLGT